MVRRHKEWHAEVEVDRGDEDGMVTETRLLNANSEEHALELVEMLYSATTWRLVELNPPTMRKRRTA